MLVTCVILTTVTLIMYLQMFICDSSGGVRNVFSYLHLLT